MNKTKLKNSPNKPGCYLFLNKKNNIIYIGKAKNLKNRITSYFNKSAKLTPSKQEMLKEISDLKTIIVNNETEALLLEINLIKKYQPKYNIVMKDDKNFSYLKIINNKLQIVKKIESDNGKYFGPFTSTLALKELIKLINFSNNEKEKNKITKNITDFLNGKPEKILKYLKTQMTMAANEKKYELAVIYRDRLQIINKIIAKQMVVCQKNKNQDIISNYIWQKIIIINIFRIRQGKLIDKINIKLNNQGENLSEILTKFITQYYKNLPQLPKEIIIPQKINISNAKLEKILKKKIKITIPQRGKYVKLIKLGDLNAQQYLINNLTKFLPNKKTIKGLKNLTTTLKLTSVPQRIECYDISNIQGKFAVGSMVVFSFGEADKQKYKKFKIKYTSGPDDYAMLAEIIARRIRHTEWPNPNLIIIDGGKGQLSIVLNTLKNAKLNWQIISLAKREEKIFLPNRKTPIILKKNSPEFFLIQRIRDEAHRFAINFYRQRHKKFIISSKLNKISKPKPKNLVKTN